MSELIVADLTRWLRDHQWLVQNGHMPKAHAIIGDPPYGLEFMNAKWDTFKVGGKFHTPAAENRVFDNASGHFFDNMNKPIVRYTAGVEFQAWVTEWATLLLDYVYPGAVLAMFGGTRTYHRLAAGLEDAGWEIFDSLAMLYCYGSGFPKSHNISKAIDKAAGAEREVIGKSARHVSGKPEQRTVGLNGSSTFAESVGMGQFLTAPATDAAKQWDGYGTSLKPAYEPIVLARAPRGSSTYAELAVTYGTGALNVDAGRIDGQPRNPGFKAPSSAGIWGGSANENLVGYESPLGRYPANLALVCACEGSRHEADCPVRVIDEQSGESVSRSADRGRGIDGATFKYAGAAEHDNVRGHEDSGGSSRFFYTAKSPSWERSAGLDARNPHPTLKPIRLITWLASLLLPPVLDVPRRVLIPFAGVASEMIGCTLAGWDEVVGIEREPEYAAINEARRKWWAPFKTYEQAELAYRPAVETVDDYAGLPLFAGLGE